MPIKIQHALSGKALQNPATFVLMFVLPAATPAALLEQNRIYVGEN